MPDPQPIKLLSFDIELANVFTLKPGEDLDRYAPFDLSVAAAVIDGGERRVWHSRDARGRPSAKMMRADALDMLRYLASRQQEGYSVCAWNGLGFDLRWLGHVAKDPQLAAEIAVRSFDPMFQFFNQRGFPVGLESVGSGMGVNIRKTMSGADAPKRCRTGHFDEVIEYVVGDCLISNEITRRILRDRCVRWVRKNGKPAEERFARLKCVAEVLRDPEPDQSWMDRPLRRSKFIAWLPPSCAGTDRAPRPTPKFSTRKTGTSRRA